MVPSYILRRSASFVGQFYGRTLSTQSHRNLILPAASVSSLRRFSTSPSPSFKDNDSLLKDTKPQILDESLVSDLLSQLQSLQRDIESLRKPNADSVPTHESLVKGQEIDDSVPEDKDADSVPTDESLVKGQEIDDSLPENKDDESLVKERGEDESLVKAEGDDESLPHGDKKENTLLKAIRLEISHFANYSHLSKKHRIIPEWFPFKIEKDNPGTRSIYLSREYEGELVEVKVENPAVYSSDGGEKSPHQEFNEEWCSSFSMPLTVGVSCMSSKSKKVEFTCSAYRDKISIYTAKDPAEDNQGVHFSDLDDNLKEEFRKYLEARGITLTTTNFLYGYMLDKANRENLRVVEKFENLLV